MTTDPRLLALQNIEVWEPVPGTSYEASNLGRLRNPKTGNFVGTCLLKNGYLSLPGMLSHRAILAAFDGPQPPRVVGRHLDNDRSNNTLPNLAWGTRAENAADTGAAGRWRSRNGAVAFTSAEDQKAVIDLVLSGDMTHKEAAAAARRSVGWVQGKVRQRRNPVPTQRQSPYTVAAARTLAENGTEVWVPTVGIGGFEVSNFGRARSAKTKHVRTISPDTPGGYLRLHDALLHRVVLMSFDDPPFEGAIIRHTPDPSRLNNALTNLQWGTYKDNGEDTKKDGRTLTGEKHPRATMTDADVEEGLRLYAEKGWTTQELSDFLPGDIGQGNASDIVNGKSWAHVPRPPGFEETRRRRSGSTHHLSRLTDEKVAEGLRVAAENGWGAVRLAEYLGIAIPTGTQILSGKTWKHVPRARKEAVFSPSVPPSEPSLPPSGDTFEPLVERVLRCADDPSFRLRDDNHAILSREDVILATREVGKGRVEGELLPAVRAFFRAHVTRWGWFYPEASGDLEGAVAEVRTAAGHTANSRAGSDYLKGTFPSYWNVDGGPAKAFHEDAALNNVLRYRLGLNNSKDYTYTLSTGEVVATRETFDINIKNVRRGFVVQRKAVSFFKPAVAKALYQQWLPEMEAPVVWDCSAGFGARLLGFAAAFPKGIYIGNEPASETFADLGRLGRDLVAGGLLASAVLHQRESEAQEIEPNSLDLVFTSPPYFDLERYFDEPSQCWRRYPTPERWFEGYLLPTVRRAASGLRSGRFLVLNVDAPRRPAVLRAAEQAGLVFVQEQVLSLGSDHFSRKRGEDAPRSEPILVFRKP